MEKPMQRLRVSENRRFLVQEDGIPFYWLGDTAWELFHKLNRAEILFYLATRAEQGFTVVQAVALAELDETYGKGNAYGKEPLQIAADGVPDPKRPDLKGDYSYWDHVDYAVSKANELGLYIALLPAWGNRFHRWPWEKEPEIFTVENAYVYGKWLGNRYRDFPGLVWVLGGDRPLHTRRHFEIVCAMAEGLREGDGGSHLMTFHPTGPDSSARQLHDEPWLDFNMVQSGHLHAKPTNDELVAACYAMSPVKPVLDAEPCYEDLPIRFKAENGYFDAVHVRRAAYYSLLSGAFGHTYGHHSVWSMSDGGFVGANPEEPFFIMGWKEALRRPGAEQMRHVKALMQARRWLELRPDLTLLAGNLPGECRRVAARGERFAYVFCPNGLYADVAMGVLEAPFAEASWFNTSDGAWIPAGRFPNAEGNRRFIAPASGRDQDWILCLDAADSPE